MRCAGWILLGALFGCDGGEGEGGGEGGGAGADAGPAVEPFTCDVDLRRAVLAEPPASIACPSEPEFVTVGGSVQVFKYEASHPMATADAAFPCADVGETDFQAPSVETQPCSHAGVRPWHSVKWEAADAACKAIGWRMCSSAELLRACGGPEMLTFAYGAMFEGGKCNVREAFRPEGEETASEAPSGQFDACESPSGAFDVNGNLWEWVSDRDEADARARIYQGAGWRTIAQRHQDANQACGTQTFLRGFSAPSFANRDVGFRCCRAVP